MTLQPELMKAILAMDAYNRGYDASITLPSSIGDQIGNASITTTSTIALGDGVDSAIGFYALAYDTNGDGTANVISYRGTDYPQNDTTPAKDIYHGWSLGAGITASEQGQIAVEFYQAIVGEGNWRTANISLTGHSLGGGLAGFVGALYDKNATVYDSMTYKAAANKAFYDSTHYDIVYSTDNGVTYEQDVVSYTQLQDYLNDPDVDVQLYALIDAALKQKIYGDLTVPEIEALGPDYVGLVGYYVNGEALDVMLPLRDGSEAELNPLHELDGIDLIPGINPFDEWVARHSQASLVITMFKDEVPTLTDWSAASQYFWPVMYDDSFAEQVVDGAPNIAGELLAQGKYADILRMTIAYSALDEGEMPFGDTGIRAFYHDANELGKALSNSVVSDTLTTHAKDISKAFVEFAGTLALNDIEMSSPSDVILDGVLTLAEEMNNHTLTIDFDEVLWEIAGNGVLPSMVAREDLAGSLLDEIDPTSAARIVMGNIWGNDTTDAFERVIFSTREGGTTDIQENLNTVGKATLFIGGDGANHVTGTSGNDLLFGGNGVDRLYGSTGNDILMGGSASDQYIFDLSTVSGVVNIVDADSIGLDSLTIKGFGYGNDHSVRGVVGTDSFDIIFSEGHRDALENFIVDNDILTIRIDKTGVLNGTSGVELLSLEKLGGTDKIHMDDFISVDWAALSAPVTLAYTMHTVSGVSFVDDGAGGEVITYADGGATAIVDEFGNTTGMVVQPLVGGWYVDRAFANEIVHPFILTGFSIETRTDEFGNYLGSNGSLQYETYIKEVAFLPGLTPDDVRFTLGGIAGDSSLTIHIDSMNYSTTIDDYEAGRLIYGAYFDGSRLQEVVGGSDISASLSSTQAGSYNGVYQSTSPYSINDDNQSVTYFLETVSFADGTVIDMLGDITFTGSAGGETLQGMDAHNDTIRGMGGDDYLWGYDGNDTLIGGTGNDDLYGGAGDDAYLFAVGDGTGIIHEELNEGIDTVYLAEGILPEDVLVWNNGLGRYYLQYSSDPADVIQILAGNDATGSLVSSYVENIVFDNGTVWDLSQGLILNGVDVGQNLYGSSAADTISGNGGDDILWGYDGNDTLIGGAGNDDLYGGAGDDAYLFAVGDGTGIIHEELNEGIDTVYLAEGILPEDVLVWNNGLGRYYLQYSSDPADVIQILAGNDATGSLVSSYVENIVFDNGTVWDLSQGLILNGVDVGQNLYGSSAADTISGNGGDDILWGYDGNDTLIGGTGNDDLYGGAGDDEYVFNLGDGVDVIDDADGAADFIRLGSGFTASDVVLTDVGANDLEITFLNSPGDKITIRGHRNGADTNQIEEIIFNAAPVASDDVITTDEDVIATFDVLANDTDADNDALSVTQVGTASNGTVVLNADGTITYMPNADFFGSDSFDYTISDGNDGATTATVNLTVNAINDTPIANDDAVVLDEDAAVTFDARTNDSDVDGDSLSVSAVSSATNGAVVINPDGTITYTPNTDYFGSDSFSYTISDGNGGVVDGSINVTVNAVNDAPVLSNNGAVVNQDSILTLTTAMLGATDVDNAASELVFTIDSVPANGTLKLGPVNTNFVKIIG